MFCTILLGLFGTEEGSAPETGPFLPKADSQEVCDKASQADSPEVCDKSSQDAVPTSDASPSAPTDDMHTAD
jgi:hypothetical protein